MAGYLFLVIAAPEFLSLAAASPQLGLTPWILAVALGIRWTLWRRRRTALMRSVPEADSGPGDEAPAFTRGQLADAWGISE
jgi:hypothetical protein